MRHLQLAPIIHVEIYKKYNIDPSSKEVNQDVVLELCNQHQSIVTSEGDYAFINAVVCSYGDFLSSDKSEAQ